MSETLKTGFSRHGSYAECNWSNMSRVMRKPAFCICENKDADQLRGNREADQRLRFRHTDSAIFLLSKSEISRLYPSSVAVQPGLCLTWSETPKTGFLTTRLISNSIWKSKMKDAQKTANCSRQDVTQISNKISRKCFQWQTAVSSLP